MNAFKTYFLNVLQKKYFSISGRANRKQYWLFILFSFIIHILLIIASIFSELFISIIDPSGFVSFYFAILSAVLEIALNIALFLPSVTIGIRRLHDIDWSGWWMLLFLIPFIGGIMLFILMLIPGTEGENRFGK